MKSYCSSTLVWYTRGKCMLRLLEMKLVYLAQELYLIWCYRYVNYSILCLSYVVRSGTFGTDFRKPLDPVYINWSADLEERHSYS